MASFLALTFLILGLTGSAEADERIDSSSTISLVSRQGANDPSPWIIPKDDLTDTLILASWNGWFGLDNHRQPVPPYSSTNASTIERQMDAAREMGIDGFIINWYGPKTESAGAADREFIDEATRSLFKATLETSDFRLALMYDYNTLATVPVEQRTTQMIDDLRNPH